TWLWWCDEGLLEILRIIFFLRSHCSSTAVGCSSSSTAVGSSPELRGDLFVFFSLCSWCFLFVLPSSSHLLFAVVRWVVVVLALWIWIAGGDFGVVVGLCAVVCHCVSIVLPPSGLLARGGLVLDIDPFHPVVPVAFFGFGMVWLLCLCRAGGLGVYS
ncbi:hypothetical protein A2U01_0014722, partial [Trifolium medium]|nr:hypothetical protein [Trifolium medium]